jgi:hypothetical protein
MEEFQLIFVLWLIKFIAACAMFLIALRWVDRRWRAKNGCAASTSQRPLTMAMSRRRARS